MNKRTTGVYLMKTWKLFMTIFIIIMEDYLVGLKYFCTAILGVLLIINRKILKQVDFYVNCMYITSRNTYHFVGCNKF